MYCFYCLEEWEQLSIKVVEQVTAEAKHVTCTDKSAQKLSLIYVMDSLSVSLLFTMLTHEPEGPPFLAAGNCRQEITLRWVASRHYITFNGDSLTGSREC